MVELVFKKMRPVIATFSLGVLFVMMAAIPALGQIEFSPTILMMSKDDPVQQLLISNMTNTPKEVEFVERFGYPVHSESGTLEMVYDDSISGRNYGLSGMLRIFPRKLLLPAGARQVVRVYVGHNEAAKEQMYWTRLGIESKAVQPAFEDVSATNGVADNDSMVVSTLFRQHIGVYYKHGSVQTGVTLNDTEILYDRDEIALLISASRTGNSPFLGIMTVRLTGRNGRVVHESERVVSLFFDDTISVLIDRDDVPPGFYTMDVSFETARGDLSDEELIKSPRQQFATELIIQGQTH